MTNYRLQSLFLFVIMVFFGIQLCTGPMVTTVGERGKQLYMEGKYDSAMTALKRSMQQHPKNAELRYYLGLAYLQQNNLDSALAFHKEAAAMKKNPTMDSTYSALMTKRATELREAEQYDAVKKWAEKAIDLDKKNKQAYYEKYMAQGLKLYFQGSKWELWDAIVAFGKASTTKPEEPMPYYYSAKSYQKKDDKDFANAIEQYNQALENNPPDTIAAEIRSQLEELKRRKKLYEDFWGN